MHRRAFLGSVVAGVSGVGLAGCLGPSEDTVEVGHIDLRNSDEQPHTVSLEALFDGDTVVDETYEIDAGATADRVESALPDDKGQYEITVDPTTFDSVMFTPGAQTEADCVTLEYELFSPDSLGVVQHSGGCSQS
jgi:hypothetical protein